MKLAHIKSPLREVVNEEFNDEGWMQTVNVREDETEPPGISIMKKKLTQTIDEIIRQLLKESPDTVRNKDGETVVKCDEGPAIAFKVMKNRETGEADVVYNDTRNRGVAAWHGDITMQSKVNGYEQLRGRVWPNRKIASFYDSEDEVKPYSKVVEEFFKERGLNIDEFNWDFVSSAETKGFQKWRAAMGGKSEEVEIPPEIKKKLAELIPQLHLTTGDAKIKIEQEIEHLYKKAGVENQKAKKMAAYMAASAEKYAPFRKGGGGFMAGYAGRLPAVAEAKVRIYNKTLCPDLWTDQNKLLPDVRQALLKIAFDFYTDSELRVPIQDVYFLGSAANYNWTPESDMDVHILIDGAGLSMHPENAEKFLHTLTGKWNLEHEIKVKGHRVELYLQDIREKNESTGVYSIVNNDWVKMPSPENVSIDKQLIQKKYSTWVQKINDAIKREDEKALKNILEALRDYRKAGLKREGEFSPENLVFKILRHRGFLEKLKDGYNQIYDKKMTVKDGFDPTSVGPNPDAGTNDTAGFYQSHNKRMRKLEEVSWKDLKQRHPHSPHIGSHELRKTTLDNLYALLQKSRRFYDAYKSRQDVVGMKDEAEEIKFYSDEIKRRLKTINAPVMEEAKGKPTKSKYFTVFWGLPNVAKGVGIIMIGNKEPTEIQDDKWFANLWRPWDTTRQGKWAINRHVGAFKLGLEAEGTAFDTPEQALKYLDDWYEKRSIKEGYGAGIPETDRLHIKNRRWQIRSKDAPKTPKMTKETVIAGDGHEMMDELINEILDRVVFKGRGSL